MESPEGLVGQTEKCPTCGHANRVPPPIPIQQAAADLAARRAMPHFASDVPPGNGRCSDNACPCPERVIPRGAGFLYIEQALVDFRRQYPTLESARQAMRERHAQMLARFGASATGLYRLGPILVCEQGAKLRNLDLAVARADARFWWRTGQVPLRPTPLAGSEEAREEREKLGLATGAGPG